MKAAQEVYEEYRIMSSLQLHQLRVAAVGKLVCGSFHEPVDAHAVVLACLFHDMGNIIKMQLGSFPEFLEPNGMEYWEGIRAEFLQRYGSNAHAGNVAIAKELKLPPRVVELIGGISFSNIGNILATGSREQKICEYADDRVGPKGVLPVSERLAEARARYIDSGKAYYSAEGFEKLSKSVYELERALFAKCNIEPGDITDEAIAPLIPELREYQVA